MKSTPMILTALAVWLAVCAWSAWSRPAAAQASGTITGVVKTTGATPAPRVVDVNKDPAVCGKQQTIVDVMVGSDHGLADAVVSVPDTKGAQIPRKAMLDQKGCEFHPDVLVMAPGELDIQNSDGVLHNIHSFSTTNPPFNMAQPKFRKIISEKIDKPEIIKVQCDVHSWMRGWLFVTNHPATVTDSAGAFKLVNLPPGKHQVEVWHPILGQQSKTVEVRPGQTVTVVFEMAAKK